MRDQGTCIEVGFSDELTPDDFAPVDSDFGALGRVPLEDVDVIVLVVVDDGEVRRFREFGLGYIDADFFEQFAACGFARRFAPVDVAAGQRLAFAVRISDQQQFIAVPHRDEGTALVGSSNEPPDPEDSVRNDEGEAERGIEHLQRVPLRTRGCQRTRGPEEFSLACVKCAMALIGLSWLRFTRAMVSGRFAPSTTGPAHPGTLLAALLCWLDARSRGGRIALRLEDLDPQRSDPMKVDAMRDDLEWLGLSWDEVSVQSDAAMPHAAALDELAKAGVLYPCSCSRADIRTVAKRSPDGGFAYPNTCRDIALPPGGWRASDQPLRARLPEGRIDPFDEGGLTLGQHPATEMGDPIVRRRDGGVAYQLASVVDDASLGVTRVVRGRDLATSTAVQVSLQRLLALPEPVYRHHALLLEEHEGGKLAKLHGSVGASELQSIYSAREIAGILAHAAGLRDEAIPCVPEDLIADFEWNRVTTEDRVMRWTGERLFCLER